MKPVDTRSRGTYRYQKSAPDKRFARQYRNSQKDPDTSQLQKTTWLMTSQSGFNTATQPLPSQRTDLRTGTEGVIKDYERDQRVLVYYLRQVETAAGLGRCA